MIKNFVPGQRIWAIDRHADVGIEDVVGMMYLAQIENAAIGTRFFVERTENGTQPLTSSHDSHRGVPI